ncbi:hypothetical protein D3C81_1971160 [compost metagenome]
MGLFSQLWIVLGLFCQHRLFDKQWAIRLQLFDQHFGHRRTDATMEVETELNLFAERFANLRHGIHRRVHAAGIINDAHLFAAVELEGVETNVA